MADTWRECPSSAKFGPHGGAQWRSPRYMLLCGCDAGYCENHARVIMRVPMSSPVEPGAVRHCRKHSKKGGR